MKTKSLKKPENTFKAHPLMLVRFLKPFLFVLVIPLLKGALQYLIYRRISGVLALEAISFSAILLIAFLRLLSFSASYNDGILTVSNGFIFKHKAVIRADKLSCVSVSQNPLDMLFKSVTYKINTEAGSSEKADYLFKFSKKDASKLSDLLYTDNHSLSVRFSPVRIAALSASGSSLLTGLLVGVPIIRYSGKLLGISIEELLFDRLNEISQKLNSYFPPAVNLITLLFIIFYGISFMAALFKNMRFRLGVGKSEIVSRSGIIVRHKTVFKKHSINCILIEQTPLMRLFRLYTTSAAVGGYGNLKGERPAIVPCGTRRETYLQLKALFPFLDERGKTLRPVTEGKNRRRYAFMPCVWYSVIAAVMLLSTIIIPHFFRLFLFLESVAAAVNTYFLFVRRFESKKGYIDFSNSVSVLSTRRLSIREMHCEKDKIRSITVVQTPADKRRSTCKVTVTVGGESAESIKIRNLSFDEVSGQIKTLFQGE